MDAPGTRPLYWSVRRELWENRSIYIAPLLAAAVGLFGSFINAAMLRHRMSAILAQSAAKQRELITMAYSFDAGLIVITAFIVGVFYCLDALYGERRDRGILFWKSQPVSDRTTVLAKASIPFAVLPALIFPIIVTTQLITLLMSTAVLLGNRPGLVALWTNVKFFQSTVALLYGLTAATLWHAPIYAWLLLVSGWSRRAAFLWAVLPLLAIGAFEKIAFGTNLFFLLLGYRLTGWFMRAFNFPPHGSSVPVDPLAHLTPGKFLSTPGLWMGLLFAAAFLAAAVRMRRYREPI